MISFKAKKGNLSPIIINNVACSELQFLRPEMMRPLHVAVAWSAVWADQKLLNTPPTSHIGPLSWSLTVQV